MQVHIIKNSLTFNLHRNGNKQRRKEKERRKTDRDGDTDRGSWWVGKVAGKPKKFSNTDRGNGGH